MKTLRILISMTDHPWPVVVGSHSIDVARYNADHLGNQRIKSITDGGPAGSADIEGNVCDVHLIPGWELVMTPTLAFWLINEASKSDCTDESHRTWIKVLEDVEWF